MKQQLRFHFANEKRDWRTGQGLHAHSLKARFRFEAKNSHGAVTETSQQELKPDSPFRNRCQVEAADTLFEELLTLVYEHTRLRVQLEVYQLIVAYVQDYLCLVRAGLLYLTPVVAFPSCVLHRKAIGSQMLSDVNDFGWGNLNERAVGQHACVQGWFTLLEAGVLCCRNLSIADRQHERGFSKRHQQEVVELRFCLSLERAAERDYAFWFKRK